MTSQTMKKLAALLGCAVLLLCLVGAKGAKRTYEIRPQIPESVFKSDSARAMDTYERMVDQVLELNKQQLDAMDLNIKEVSRQLYRVEAKLDQLLNRSPSIKTRHGMPPVGVEDVPTMARPRDPNTAENGQEAR